MSLFTARGEKAKESATTEKLDLSKVYYRFKAGESAKVRVLSAVDYVEYKAHSDFNHKVWTQPCTAILNRECALCTASKAGIEEFEGLYARHRYIFVFADIATGELMALDVSKNQAKKLIADIEEYKDYLGAHSFTLVRTGTGTDSAYSLKVNIAPPKGAEADTFNSFNDKEVEDNFFNSVLQARSLGMQINILKDAGFPVEKHFSAEALAEAEAGAEQAKGNTQAPTATAPTVGDLPF